MNQRRKRVEVGGDHHEKQFARTEEAGCQGYAIVKTSVMRA